MQIDDIIHNSSCDPILENGAYGTISGFELCIYACCAKLFLHLVLVSCLYEHPIKSYKQKRKKFLYRLLLRKSHFSLNTIWSILGSFKRKGTFNLTSSLAFDSLYIGNKQPMYLLSHCDA